MHSTNVDVGVWPKLSKVVIVLLFLAGGLGVALWYLPVIKQNEAMRKEILRLKSEIAQQDEIGHQLNGAIAALKNDPKTVERIAREKLAFIKPGDTMIRFESPSTGLSPSR